MIIPQECALGGESTVLAGNWRPTGMKGSIVPSLSHLQLSSFAIWKGAWELGYLEGINSNACDYEVQLLFDACLELTKQSHHAKKA